jgi:ribosome-interacting GTPase 1
VPTNLPPDYFEIEKQFRAAGSTADKIRYLEEMMSVIPKHKGTDRLRADLRKKLSKLKSEAQGGKKKGTSRHDSAYHIDREGAGQAVLAGPTNVGKSALLAALTNAAPEVSEAPYTTWTPTPGMMPVENIQIQLVDTPPLNPDYVEPDLLDLIRRVDVILLVVDLQTDPVRQLEESVAILRENNIAPQRFRGDYSEEEQRRTVFKPLLVLVNKCDDPSLDELCEIFEALLDEEWPMVAVSAQTQRNVDQLKWAVFDRLNIIRVYSQAPGQEPDLTAPFVLGKGGTVGEFAAKVHRDFYENLKAARVWGSAQFDGQMVSRDHVLRDGDIVELRI